MLGAVAAARRGALDKRERLERGSEKVREGVIAATPLYGLGAKGGSHVRADPLAAYSRLLNQSATLGRSGMHSPASCSSAWFEHSFGAICARPAAKGVGGVEPADKLLRDWCWRRRKGAAMVRGAYSRSLGL